MRGEHDDSDADESRVYCRDWPARRYGEAQVQRRRSAGPSPSDAMLRRRCRARKGHVPLRRPPAIHPASIMPASDAAHPRSRAARRNAGGGPRGMTAPATIATHSSNAGTPRVARAVVMPLTMPRNVTASAAGTCVRGGWINRSVTNMATQPSTSTSATPLNAIMPMSNPPQRRRDRSRELAGHAGSRHGSTEHAAIRDKEAGKDTYCGTMERRDGTNQCRRDHQQDWRCPPQRDGCCGDRRSRSSVPACRRS